MASEVVLAVVEALGSAYSAYSTVQAGNKQDELLKAQEKALASQGQQKQLVAPTPDPSSLNTPQNYNAMLADMSRIQQKGMGGLSPSYLKDQAVLDSGNPDMSSVAQQVITQMLGQTGSGG